MKVLNLNSEALLAAASMLKVLGHPIRISIVELLEESPRMSVTEIFKALRIEQAIASHHLNTLKNKRVLSSERVGKNTYYSVSHVGLIAAVKSVRDCQ
ncbi:MAG: metalloregulator ArsR/SmtB family transcription factor [Flavobacteriales bacterium]|nr:metalloregulator ArsR/SmtB family transcription factor [Flavobacteriales bacterium]